MNSTFTYKSGKPPRQVNVDAVLDAITDQVLADGDVEKALQRAFRFGTEDDMGLLDILDRLREEIQEAEHEMAPEDQHGNELARGDGPRSCDDAVAMRDALRQVESLDDLQGLDPEMMQKSLTSEEMEWVDRWSDMTGQLIDSGLVAMSGHRMVLTAKAIRSIGSRLLQHMYLPPKKPGRGTHLLHRPGTSGLATDESSEWEWGKSMDLDVSRSIMNAVRQFHARGEVRLLAEDFEVLDRESGAAIATVMLTDMSRSMFESGAWDAAKRAAIALNTLITTTRLHDDLDLVGFSGDARELRLEELPELTWDQFSHGTNLHSGLIVAGRLLNLHRSKNRQIVIITDGEPTAFMDGADPVFEHPVTDRTIHATLLEAKRLERQRVNFTVICVGESDGAPEFAQILARTVNGRLIQLPLDELGSFVVRDVASGSFRLVR